jgi:hypothetical protein
MKFGFFFNYDNTYTLVKLFNALAKRIPSAKVSGFVLNDRYVSYARDNLPPGSRLIPFYGLLAQARLHKPTTAELTEFRLFDERHRLSRVAYSDRHLSDWRYEELIPHYIHLIAAFRHYVATEKPDIFIFDIVASQHAHLLYLVLRDEGVKVLMPWGFGIEDLHYIADNPYFECPEVWDLFEAMREGRETPQPNERAWAMKFMSHIRSGEPAYFNNGISLEARKFSLPNVGRLFKYVQNYFLYDRNDPNQRNPLSRLWSILRLRFNRAVSRRYFVDARDLDGDFVLFALHFEPEVATLVLSQYDQLSVIDLIVRQLPLSCRLVLKEHPAMAGQRDWRFYREALRKYPNLVFVATGVSVNQLVRRARALVTLNGTAILETLILQRPVVYTSRARFGGFGLGAFTENLIRFSDALAAAEKRIPDDETLVLMLSAIHRKSRRFEFVEPLGNLSTLADDNIEKIADAFMERLVQPRT